MNESTAACLHANMHGMAKRSRVTDASPPPPTPPEPARCRVLLADDSVLTCELFGEYLSRRGFGVIFAHDGEATLAQALESRPDVIVLDLSMPRLDGVATIKRLKEDAHLRRVPVIVLTGHVGEARRQEALTAGAAAFLVKPCLPDEIERVIGEVLTRAA